MTPSVMASMTASTELAPARRAERVGAGRSGHGRPPRLTLEDLVLNVWEDLGEGGLADCPVCRGPLEATGCRGCGSHLG